MFETVRIISFAVVLLVLGIIDFRRGIIPNKIVYPSIIGAIILNTFSSEITIAHSLAGGVVLSVFFIISSLILKNLGMGDVKLGFLIGLMIGFPNGMIALVCGVVFGGLAAMVLVITKMRDRKDSIPYGPFLVTGALLTLVGVQLSLFDFLYTRFM